jgi:hypothetical protein
MILRHDVSLIRAQVEYAGQVIEQWSFETGEFVDKSIVIPLEEHQGIRTAGRLVFRVVNPTAPLSLDMSADSRLLGLGFVTLRLEERSFVKCAGA